MHRLCTAAILTLCTSPVGIAPAAAQTPSPPVQASAASGPEATISSEPSLTPSPNPSFRPEGTWQATAFDPFGTELLSPLPGSTLTVSFLPDGRLEGVTACGGYIGGYSVDATSIALGVLTTGTSPCGRRRSDEEFQFTQALQAATSWAASSDGLELRDAEGRVRVTLVPPRNGGLEVGTGGWTVLRFAVPGGKLREPIDGTGLDLVFASDGTLTGGSGCRRFEGSYLAEGDRLVMSAITFVAGSPCRDPETRQLRRYRRALESVARWTRDGDRLLFIDLEDHTLVELEPAPGLASPPPG